MTLKGHAVPEKCSRFLMAPRQKTGDIFFACAGVYGGGRGDTCCPRVR